MNINELMKGIIIGIAKIIPGLSGAILMISFNLYDRAIYAITCFFENPKKHFLFLMNLGIGILLGIILFSKVIHYFITNYYLYTTALFIGLILGGIPTIKKNISKNRMNYLLIGLAFFFMSLLSFSNLQANYSLKNNYIDLVIFFLAGLLEALGTVLPGISSTALLMLIGVYDYYIETIGNTLNLCLLQDTLYFLLPFSLGLFFGVIAISLLVNYLFHHWKEQTFSFILGVSLASVFLLLVRLCPYVHGVFSCLFSFLLFTLGYIITRKL